MKNVSIEWYPRTKASIMGIQGFSDFASGGKLLKHSGYSSVYIDLRQTQFYFFYVFLYRFGEWVEIVVDDRLPTRNGKLIYLRSVEKNEFWGALLEKAYAKLHGSYKNLEGGLTIEAAVDFTGGIPEMINLTRSKIAPERLFYIMSKADDQGSFMGAALAVSPIEG